MVEDAIGLLILVIVAVALLIIAGLSVLFSLDAVAAAVSWFGWQPTVGWAALGLCSGTFIGIVHGMRMRGKSDDLRKVYVAVAMAAFLLAAAGITSPAGHSMLGW